MMNREVPGITRILLALLVLSPGSAYPGDTRPDAKLLIDKMSQSARELDYDGVFIYRRGQQMDTLRLIHKADNGNEYERLVSLTGDPREVIRNNQSVTCYFPDNEAVMVEKSRPEKLLANQLSGPIEKILQYYLFDIAGEDRIAGRNSWIVDIKPQDMYRYGYQLWIDKDNYLLLKSELKNKSGFPLEQIIFTQLTVYDSIPQDLLKPTISGTGYTWTGDNSAEAMNTQGRPAWKVTWLPGGFILKNHERQKISASRNPVDHIIFTDGLAMVSVFIEKLANPSQMSLGPSRMGGINTFARVAKGYQVTAVGEVPQSTVQRMANSVISDQ